MQSTIDIIQAHQQEILSDWELAIRQMPVARDLPRSTLINRFPQLLDRIVRSVKDLTEGQPHPTIMDNSPEIHALDRLDCGFDLRHVVSEYAVLRSCILQLLENHALLVEPGSVRLVNQAIDRAISESVGYFTRAHDRTLQALDRVSVAALERQDLGDFLQELLRVLVAVTGSVDTAVILLREGDELRVRAAVGLAEGATTLSFKLGEGIAGTVAVERRPCLTQSASNDPFVQSAAFARKDIQALYSVPLVEGDGLVGVAQIGSFTAPDFSTQDKNLFMALANRATAGISQYMLREGLMRAIKMRENVLAVVSHDLRNPLNVIQMSAALILLETPLHNGGERARSCAERIIRSVQRMASLMKDLLDIASIDAGRFAIHPEEHEVDEILREALDTLLPLATEKSLRIQREAAPSPAIIRCDRERIVQVLSNLVGNAIKFTPEGGLISVGARPEGDHVLFTVRDTGPGIAAKDLPHLFEAYWQANATVERKTGIGLGLAISKGIVETHGGRIWAESTPGEGSSFHFTLPLSGAEPHGLAASLGE